MRILVVTSQFPIAGEPTRGRPIHQTVRALSRLADVRVLSPIAVYPRWARPRSYLFHAPLELALDCAVEYVTYPAFPALTRPFNGWLCGRAIDAAVRHARPDVLLSYWLYPDAHGALRAARRHAIPFVAGARGSDLRVRDAVSRRLTLPVVRSADRLLVVSADLGRIASERYGADPARVRVIPNGCDTAIFHLLDRAVARRELDLPERSRIVLYVGRLVAEKGLRELLTAAAELARNDAGLVLALVGDGPLRAELEAMARSMPGLALRFAGAQPPAAVARWMSAADVVTLPSYSEGHPNVLVEALACGRPAVATTVGGIPEVIDAASGVLVPPRDTDALARGLGEALARDWDERTLSRQSSRSWDEVAADTLKACSEAIATHQARA